MPKQELKAPMAEMKRCAGRAKTKLFQLKHETLRKYYLEECAKSGVFPVKAIKGIAPRIPLGEPTGKERYKITMRAYGVAQTKIRKEYKVSLTCLSLNASKRQLEKELFSAL